MTEFIAAAPTAMLVFDKPTTYVDRTLATASWRDEYEILTGAYPFEWVNINHKPWNANPEACTPGFVGNTGPYYGLVRVEAMLKQEYREARLLSECRSTTTLHNIPKPKTLVTSVYAYTLPGCPRIERSTLTSFMGGRVVPIQTLAQTA